MEKRKVLLDSDVIIHFVKGQCFSLLPDILPDFDFVILDVVYESELKLYLSQQIEQTIRVLRKLSILEWHYTHEEFAEFCRLQSIFGVGESACMTYCRHHNREVLGSSNLRDIRAYFERHEIDYFTTMDFLYQAWKDGLMSEAECDAFIQRVKSQKSKLPVSRMAEFAPRVYFDKTVGQFINLT